MLRRTAILAAVFALSPPAQQQTASLIKTDDLRADIFFLASGDLAGRHCGSLGDHIATDYIAAQFMRLGLRPVGDNGTYFQNMELV